jgi:hypothetical protein
MCVKMPNAVVLCFVFLAFFIFYFFYPEARTAFMQASEQNKRPFPTVSPGVSQ